MNFASTKWTKVKQGFLLVITLSFALFQVNILQTMLGNFQNWKKQLLKNICSLSLKGQKFSFQLPSFPLFWGYTNSRECSSVHMFIIWVYFWLDPIEYGHISFLESISVINIILERNAVCNPCAMCFDHESYIYI